MYNNKKILLIVMDGVGFSASGIGDAVTLANTPVLDKLLEEYPNTRLKAHGVAVGLPSDEDMGNSEVGHNALGCGQVYSQGAKLVDESVASGKLFISDAWKEVAENAKNSTLHFIGLLSDGNVHSNISQLFALIKQAKKDNVKKVRVHILLDGRDVPATSALDYIAQTEEVLKELNDGNFDAKIASGGGRMKITMDRYQADWNMIKLGFETHAEGKGRQFSTAKEAVETFRAENSNIIDQDLPPFVIAENGEPIGKIVDKDSVVLFNFRGDRAIELSLVFDKEKTPLDVKVPDVVYAGLLQYDGDLQLPKRFLVSPPEIKDTLTELLDKNGIRQYAVSETQKYGHVTYFWNGNRSNKFSSEDWQEIQSDKISFDKKPWMKSAEITEDIINTLNLPDDKKYGFIRVNYPNGDMVGHTGDIDATRVGVESVDLALAQILPVAEANGYVVMLTADHGNADEMLEKDKKGNLAIRTAHSLNPVPLIICDKSYKITPDDNYGLANVAPTVAKIFGLTPPEAWEKPVI